jgi:hypothetical protein
LRCERGGCSGVGEDPKRLACGLLSTALLQPTLYWCPSQRRNTRKEFDRHTVRECVALCYEIIHSVAANVWTLTAMTKINLHVTRAICDDMPFRIVLLSQISTVKVDVPTWQCDHVASKCYLTLRTIIVAVLHLVSGELL